MAEESEDQRQFVFVYGNLREGFWHDFLLEGRPVLGEARTEQSYALRERESVYVSKQTAISPITGDLYEVDVDTLHSIDLLRGHPDWYYRERVNVITGDGAHYTAWMYFRDDIDKESSHSKDNQRETTEST